jgi:hypothetical protein
MLFAEGKESTNITVSGSTGSSDEDAMQPIMTLGRLEFPKMVNSQL